MKFTNLAASLLLTLSMGLTIGCAEVKSDADKQNKTAEENVNNANKQIGQLNSDHKTLLGNYSINVMTGYYSSTRMALSRRPSAPPTSQRRARNV